MVAQLLVLCWQQVGTSRGRVCHRETGVLAGTADPHRAARLHNLTEHCYN